MATTTAIPTRSEAAENGFETSGIFRYKDADGRWQKVEAGRWYMRPKARPEWLMVSDISKEARQIYECGDLGTMGWRQEVAVVAPDTRMTREHICRATGLTALQYKRGFRELEEEGVALRRPIDPEQPLQSGNIELCFWAEPQPLPPKSVSDDGVTRDPIPSWLPEELHSFVKRLRLNLLDTLPDHPLDGVAREPFLEGLKKVARALAEAEQGAREALQGVCAGSSIYKGKERKESKQSSSSEETPEPAEVPATTTTDPDIITTESGSAQVGSNGVAGNGSLPGAFYTTGRGGLPADVKQSSAMPSPQPASSTPDEDVSPVIDAVQKHHQTRINEPDARQIVEQCRKKHQSVTPAEVARFVTCVSPIKRNGTVYNPVGFLKTAIPKEITEADLAVLRETPPPASSPPPSPPAAAAIPEYDESEFEVVSSRRCQRCGGMVDTYRNGQDSVCGCRGKP